MSMLKDFISKDWTRGEKVLLASTCILAGIIVGFLIAPIKKGIQCGNNNGNTTVYGEEERE
ncbi:hypothetical protein EDD66_11098 [Mobilisporobacter senegalensis]|uniref:Uncharacterized protein n=1 Tax=Mobilisporobacter senegalensis TaxID=1329262 RepID=A0A3N1XHX7_9FIRM|nr:hypothetical protein [Mobilisporobacter senegalensis]ROR25741.1 hypothetical protein EDD66_11098 [Mobilisporobacter senegalensis]